MVDTWPESDNALSARREIAFLQLDADNLEAAREEIDLIINIFGGNDNLPTELYNIGLRFSQRGQVADALKLHKYNSSSFPAETAAMRSQSQIVQLNIKDGNEAGADAAYAGLLEVFAGQETFPEQITAIADVYIDVNNFEKAGQLEQYVIDKWPKTNHAMNAQIGIVKIHFAKDDLPNANTALDTLIADYNDNSQLSVAMLEAGRTYWDKAQAEAKKDIPVRKLGSKIPPNREQLLNKVVSDKTKDYYTKAQIVWERFAQDLPDASWAHEAHHFTALSYQVLEQHEKAIEYYQAVVDKWPDYEQAAYCQFMIGELYRELQQTGELSKQEAEPKIKQAFEQYLANYPHKDNGSFRMAQRWLKGNEEPQLNAQISSRHRASITESSRINTSAEGEEQ